MNLAEAGFHPDIRPPLPPIMQLKVPHLHRDDVTLGFGDRAVFGEQRQLAGSGLAFKHLDRPVPGGAFVVADFFETQDLPLDHGAAGPRAFSTRLQYQ
ncbi:MAG: hypothetical protein OXI81_06935 [Paracoccaceae bacterium]|nr:hypothetical protein [Paracoccaceae bacterium]